ncbi:MAG: prepilin-type N-terminal cleavage/methylation domain-containing protein, partial [Kiritimatiellia bacterium]
MKRGFTLIELLVVIVIIGILVSGVFMMMRAGGDKAGIAQT